MQRNNFSHLTKDGLKISSKSRDVKPVNTVRLSENVHWLGRVDIRAEPVKNDGNIQATKSEDQNKGIVSSGRGSAPRAWRSNGSVIRKARGRNDTKGPFFNLRVPENGYAWWYIDGISTDNEKAISVIAFIGSVFSPWYRWYGRKNPHNHCCINVVTYGKKGRWTMTERGESAVILKDDTFKVGPSSMRWVNNKLIVDINELTTPHLSRLKGQVIIEPSQISNIEVPLKSDGTHIWRPFSPISKIHVDLNIKGWNWSGHGYLDGNFGTRALEDDFSYWTWSRLTGNSESMTFYDANLRDGSIFNLGLRFDNNGDIDFIEGVPKTSFSRSLWQVYREARSDSGYQPRQIQNFLDSPFYSRSKIRTRIQGNEVEGVHEALDLNRFANPLIKPMLALRIPRKRK